MYQPDFTQPQEPNRPRLVRTDRVRFPTDEAPSAEGIGAREQPVTAFLGVYWKEFNGMRSRDRDSEYRKKIAEIIERMDTDVKERLHGLTDAYQTQMLDVMDRALKASAPVKEARGPGMAEMVGSLEIQEQIASEKQLMEKVLEIEMRHADEKLASDLRYLQDLYRRYRFVMRDYMG